MTAAEIVAALGMKRHPEGGWYVETFRDSADGGRGHSTAIYFLLEEGDSSHWHRVTDAAEIWHFYAGAPLELELWQGGDAAVTTLLLGTGLTAGERPRGSCRVVAGSALHGRVDACWLHGGAGLRLLLL